MRHGAVIPACPSQQRAYPFIGTPPHIDSKKLGRVYPEGRMSPSGTTRTSCDVRDTSAIGGIMEISVSIAGAQHKPLSPFVREFQLFERAHHRALGSLRRLDPHSIVEAVP
jgi:hypothetical protein